MYFDFDFPTLSIIFFGAALLCMVYVLAIYCRNLWKVNKLIQQCAENQETEAESLPKASVIVFTQDSPEALSANLPKILSQQYAPGFDVIVVNDGASPEVNMVVGSLKMKYHNIYLTFIPNDSRNLSRKKLGITLGIKAAKNPVVVLVDAHTSVDSSHWLATLMRGFSDPSVEMVLGHGSENGTDSQPSALRAFDASADALAWIRGGMQGRPYRGCGYNIAFKKDLFFRHKGFASSINLRHGEDDIFISQAATPTNCRLELSPEAMVEHKIHNLKREMRDNRISHAFTGRKLYKGTRRIQAIGEWSIWLIFGLSIAGAVIAGMWNVAGWCIAAFLILLTLALTGIFWNKTLRGLRSPRILPILLPFQAMGRPLRNIAVGLVSKKGDHSHYTWQ